MTVMDPVNSEKNAQESRPQMRLRKRARKACLSCRARKVRCDVSQRGRPCTHCYHDSETCIVTGRASKFRRALLDPRDGIQASYPPYPPLEQQSCDANDAQSALESILNGRHSSCTQEPKTFGQGGPETPKDDTAQSSDGEESIPPDRTSGRLENPLFVRSEREASPIATSHDYVQTENPTLASYFSSSVDSQQISKAHTGSSSNVIYCFYPFLAVTNLQNVPHQDVNFLELQGCLHVPIRALLDDLIRQYFFHVHPILPLVNEGNFWELYCHDVDKPPAGRMSLLVFQAMLFASCNFVSHSTMEGLGYATIRAMRASFYRRTKLLYDLGTETSHLAISQAALLLSFTSLSSAKKPNTSWLTLAIDNAKSAEAHLYAVTPVSHIPQQQALLKRVWWCCIIRDRSVGLLMRRPIQITKDHFDFNASPLGFADFTDEFERSKVYSSETKRTLAEILAQSIKLYIVLTDVLMLCFPVDDTRGWNQEAKFDNATRLVECKRTLRGWYDQATLRLAIIPGDTSPRILLDEEVNHDSITLYRNFMLMYYHTSRAVLCHHEVLYLDVLQGRGRTRNGFLTEDLSMILDNQHELQDAASSITECHKQLVHLNLARWLPVSAIGCTVLPLVLNILDIKLSAPVENPETSSNTVPALKQVELNILIEVMKTYQPQYEGVDWIGEIIQHIINLAQLDNLTPQIQKSSIGWSHIFAFQPSSYLRLALALDLSLSKGRLPQDRDFPLSLRGLFAVNFSPIKEMVEPNYPSYCINNNRRSPNFNQDIEAFHPLGLDIELPTQRIGLPFDGDQTDQTLYETPQDHIYLNWTSLEFEDTEMPLSGELCGLRTRPDEKFSLQG